MKTLMFFLYLITVDGHVLKANTPEMTLEKCRGTAALFIDYIKENEHIASQIKELRCGREKKLNRKELWI